MLLRLFRHPLLWCGCLMPLIAAGCVAGLRQLGADDPAKPLPSTPQPRAQRYDPLIAQAAQKHMPLDWDWRLLKAMVRKESNFDADAQSPGGAVGLTQLLPSTARHLGLRRNEFFDPLANLQAGARYLRRCYDRFNELPDQHPNWLRTRMAIAAYNAGPGRASQAKRAAGSASWSAVAPHLPSSTVTHVERIIEEFYPRYRGSEAPTAPSIARSSARNTTWRNRERFWPYHRWELRPDIDAPNDFVNLPEPIPEP